MPRQLGQQRLRRASRGQVGTLTLGPSTVLDFLHKQSPLGTMVFDNPKQITRLNVKTVVYIYNTYLPLVRDYSRVVLCTRGFFSERFALVFAINMITAQSEISLHPG